MGFMKGLAPQRRTLEYLNSGGLQLRNQLNIFLFAYHHESARSSGAKEFYFWHWDRLIHQNPDVQFVKEVKGPRVPNPYIQCFLQDGRQVLVDIDWLSHDQIYERVKRTFGKTMLSEQVEQLSEALVDERPCFGSKYSRHCMCELQGQQACPSCVPIPEVLTGVWRWNRNVRAE